MNDLGFPLREALDPERDGWYEVDDNTVDYAQAALDEYRKATKNQDPGVRLKVVDTYEGDEDRPEAARRPASRGEQGLGDVGTGLGGTRDLSG